MNWYYAKGSTQFGPLSQQDLTARVRAGEIGPETYVWQPQFGNWKSAKDVPGLLAVTDASATPATSAITLAGQTLAKVVIGLLIAGCALDAISFLTTTSAIGGMRDAFELLQPIAILGVIVYCVTAGFFAAWAYHAHKNLSAFGVRNLRYTPGWAVGGFFIPFLNVVRPFQVFREIWKASDPATNQDSWMNTSTGALLVSWWIAYITTGVVSQIAFRLPLEDALPFSLFSDLLSVGATVLALLVVRGIYLRQQEKATRGAV